jgi:hypothetical protein
MIDSLKLGNVFFEALDYPSYARPNFFIIKQRQSGWSKGVYLTTLSEVYHSCIMVLQINHGAQKRTQPNLKIEDLSLSLKDFSFLDVDVKSRNMKVNKQILEELHLAVIASYSFEKSEPNYTPYEILSFVEYALWFVRNEFRIQTKEIIYHGSRPRTESYFIYHIAQDGPFFNLPVFKAAINELLLTSKNFVELKLKLTVFYKAAKGIVDLYNNKVYLIEDSARQDPNGKAAEIVRVEFKATNLKHSWWNDEDMFELKQIEPYLNQNLAAYAAQIANFLSGIVLPRTRKEIRALERDFINDLLIGINHYNETDYTGWKKPIKENPKHEWPYRDWFHSWFGAKDYAVHRETLKGAGHIDLKVGHASLGIRKVEFKGWWNSEKKNLVGQIFGYLTRFDGTGYLVIINTTKDNIDVAYKAMISKQVKEPDIIKWYDEKFPLSSYKYYRTQHRINGHEKELYHFIIDGPITSKKSNYKKKPKTKKRILR